MHRARVNFLCYSGFKIGTFLNSKIASMKAIERPAKNIFSQQKKDKIFEKNYKSAMEKTLAPIVVESVHLKRLVSKKRKLTEIGEKRERKKNDLQTTTVAHKNLSQNSTKTSKSLSSDKKRLESLKEWQKQLNQQKIMMKKALSTNNAKDGLNKKIIFDCEEFEINKTDWINEGNSEFFSKVGKLKPLFGESSLEESDSEEKLNERFRYKNEFEGKSGKKLKELQRKYGNDDRFKLSEKFLDSDDANGNVEEMRNFLTDNDDQDAIKDEEIKNSLKIADEILQNNEIRIKSKTNKIFKDVTALRLDPDKIIHKKLIQSPNKMPKKKSVTTETLTKYEEIPSLPKVGNTSYYEVDTSLKEAFTAFTEQPFSLLASFANPAVPLEAGISNDEVAHEKVFEQLNPLEDDGISDDEELETGNDTDIQNVGVACQSLVACPDKSFFFMGDDKRLAESVKKFHRTMEEEEMWKQWKEQYKTIKLLGLIHTPTNLNLPGSTIY